MGVLGLQERVRSAPVPAPRQVQPFHLRALVYLPRERFNTDVRLRIEAMLKDALHGEYVDSSCVLGESPLAQVHLNVRPKPVRCSTSIPPNWSRTGPGAANWQYDLREALVARHGETEGLRIAPRIGKALRPATSKTTAPAVAANDVSQLDALTGPTTCA